GVAGAQDLPQSVTGLGLTDIQVRERPRAESRHVRGTLPSGTRVEVDLDRNGKIEEIEARGDGLFPISEIVSIVPQAVLDSPTWPADAQLEQIEFKRGGRIEIEGRLADGQEFEAEFSAD